MGQEKPTAATRPLVARVTLAVAIAAGCLSSALATPPTPARVAELCKDADGPAHCARLIEAEQMRALPSLAKRDGDTLRVTLFPSGARELVDTETLQGAKTFALWDYWSPVNTVVLLTTDLDRTGFALLQRATDRLTAVPAEPILSPDRQRVAVADFCAASCDNEISVWRIARDGIRRESTFRPGEPWNDVTLTWRGDETLEIEYTRKGQTQPEKTQRRLADAGWQRVEPR
jgi:hypothetical protein